MNSLFLSHRVEHAVFEANSPSEIEILFDIGYGCSAIDDRPKCSYTPSQHHPKHNNNNLRTSKRTDQNHHEHPELGEHTLRSKCFFYDIEEAYNFYRTHKPPKNRGYHNVHCFLKTDAVSTDALVRQEAEKYTDKLLEYDGNFFRVVSRNGKPFLEEQHFQQAAPFSSDSLSAVKVSFRTMFLIESDMK